MLLGDFNDILLPSEQRGGIFSQTRASKFSQVMSDCDLLDLEFFGSLLGRLIVEEVG